jgi:hypothetical protein
MTSLDDSSKSCIDFITSNPYPSYDIMDEKLDRRIDLSSEYAKSNHNFCKKLYENFEDPSKFSEILDNANKIFNCGGFQALYCNIETVRYFSPLSNCKDTRLIEKFDNIIIKLIDQYQ